MPSLPQFPAGSQLALVRQMMLVDEEGSLTPTKLTEQVQVRVHRSIPNAIPEALGLDSNEATTSLDVVEFRLSRERLFAGRSGGLRAVAREEREFPLFQSHGRDLLETAAGDDPLERHMRPTLRSCASCHFRPGIHSVLSREGREVIASSDSGSAVSDTIGWKHTWYDCGLLEGLWEVR